MAETGLASASIDGHQRSGPSKQVPTLQKPVPSLEAKGPPTWWEGASQDYLEPSAFCTLELEAMPLPHRDSKGVTKKQWHSSQHAIPEKNHMG